LGGGGEGERSGGKSRMDRRRVVHSPFVLSPPTSVVAVHAPPLALRSGYQGECSPYGDGS